MSSWYSVYMVYIQILIIYWDCWCTQMSCTSAFNCIANCQHRIRLEITKKFNLSTVCHTCTKYCGCFLCKINNIYIYIYLRFAMGGNFELFLPENCPYIKKIGTHHTKMSVKAVQLVVFHSWI